jgi:hypothetical protein
VGVVSLYRLKYRAGAYDDAFTSIRYPAASSPGYSSRERAEQVLAFMPKPELMEIEEEEED